MAAEPLNPTRHGRLRGKSVSEPCRTVDWASTDEVNNGSQPPSQSAVASPGRRGRSKTQGNIEISAFNDSTAHFSMPDLPPLPAPQHGHSDTARPRAAVVPLAPTPAFESPDAPTPLRIRRSLQASPSALALDAVALAVTIDTAVDSRRHQGLGEPNQDYQATKFGQQDGRMGSDESSDLVERLEAETERLEEQNKVALASIHQHLMSTRSSTSMESSSTSWTSTRSPVLGRFSMFYKARRSHATISRTPSIEPPLPQRSIIDPNFFKMSPPASPRSPNFGPNPHVTVRYRDEFVNISVMPQTSTVDILNKASELMASPINLGASVVYERYASLGLERRLRSYERISGVIGSWGDDGSNFLVILHSTECAGNKDLDMSHVTGPEGVSEVPINQASSTPGFTMQLHHCSRPGKWHKRWITLLEDGQMLSSKKFVPNLADKDSKRLCRLSESDIYTLTARDGSQTKNLKSVSAKNLKPPSKYVYAVKCQQKPITSRDTANFVHFFCTEDPAVASKFHSLVHSWRSWYTLKAVREALRKRLMDNAIHSAPQITPVKPVKQMPKKAINHLKVDASLIGQDQPLLDMDQFDKSMEEFGKNWTPEPKLSIVPPLSTGTNSTVYDETPLMTPSTEEKLVMGKELLPTEVCSPSEDRRKRRYTKHSPGLDDDSNEEGEPGVAIIISNMLVHKEQKGNSAPSPSPSLAAPTEPEASPPPEVSPWLPSAAEHTARLKAEKSRLECLNSPIFPPPRPNTSAGVPARSLPDRRAARRGNANRSNTTTLGNLATHYRAASKWAETSSGSGAGERPSSSGAKFLDVPGGSVRGHNLPAVWRDHTATTTPPPGNRHTSAGASERRRTRSGSGSSMRRVYGGIGAPPSDAPPMPPMPLHLRPGGANSVVAPAAEREKVKSLGGKR